MRRRRRSFQNTKKTAVILAALFLGMNLGRLGQESTDADPSYQQEQSKEQEQAYRVNEDNIPDFTEEEKNNTTAFEYYGALDELGRCSAAYANVCPQTQPTQERGEIGHIKPSGWHMVKYSGLVEGNYLYNRCHLIGYQLTGENANERNLITGTRYMNTKGMLPFEEQIDDYVDATGNHVLYRVTPIFEGSDLVAKEVRLEAWSVEDGGKGVCFDVTCYNIQPGIEIDYATGESRLAQ